MEYLIISLADLLSLVYHEGRNVRHLIKDGHIPGTGWERILSLPRNRLQACKVLQKTRNQARKSTSAYQACRVFEDRFGVSLQALIELYANPNWYHARHYGGNAWEKISLDVSNLVVEIYANQQESASVLIKKSCLLGTIQALFCPRLSNWIACLRETSLGCRKLLDSANYVQARL